jgi:DNA-binding PadR family transcriptional regulator
MPVPNRKPSTTGYAVLGLLGVRSWSAYELTKQIERSLRWFWPRSGNMLYEIPKQLAASGWARDTEAMTGRRRRTVYHVTAAGRRAFKRWLAEPSSPPALEFEALVRVYLADQGSQQDLQRTLRRAHQQALEMQEFGGAIAHEFVPRGGPFPERLHVNALIFDFMWRYTEAIRTWAEWALAEVETWDSTAPQPARHDALMARYRRVARIIDKRHQASA